MHFLEYKIIKKCNILSLICTIIIESIKLSSIWIYFFFYKIFYIKNKFWSRFTKYYISTTNT